MVGKAGNPVKPPTPENAEIGETCINCLAIFCMYDFDHGAKLVNDILVVPLVFSPPNLPQLLLNYDHSHMTASQ